MNKILLGLSTAMLLAGCGDSVETTNEAAGGSTSSTGTGGNTTSEGGGGSGGDTTTTSEGGGGSGGAELLPDGSPCTDASECAGGGCIKEDSYGWPGGYCTGTCNADIVPCADPNSTCLSNLCFVSCVDNESACSDSQTCYDSDGDGSGDICIGYCTDDSQCTSGSCDTSTGACVPMEDCSNGEDDNDNGFQDCEDTDCASSCATTYETACAAAEAASSSNSGDTTGLSADFAGSCTGFLGEHEAIYSYTPDTSGVLHATLTSETDMGIYVRTSCTDASTELGCTDVYYDGVTPEELFVEVEAGVALTIFVDGFGGYGYSQEGPFTLDLEIVQPGTETEPNDSFDTANAVSGSLVYAEIAEAGDNDWFAVTVSEGDTLSATVVDGGGDVCAPTGDIDTEIEILDTDGATSLAYVDDLGFSNYCSAASVSDLAAGTYFVRVSASTSYCPSCTFNYGLVVDASQ